ncbi:hypothetical protein [Chryseobacterium hagamense]|uniref:Lipoprotein n=1 Tax=Chryseobacterium hagamense TaxID=395935 RepID=A0A511YJW7_9FLAO|nr:hypothetical protein [Chryseobacterium hagamense]GEN75446.1 hypothetical protein CHA01nite_11860 [Chryseobacterium hagamense]
MKKNLINFVSISVFLVVSSCSNDIDSNSSTNIVAKSKTSKNVQNNNFSRSSNDELDKFVSNKNLQKIIENIDAYKKAAAIDDVDAQHQAIDVIVQSSNLLLEDYGGKEEVVMSFFEELEANDSSPSQRYYMGGGDKCHKNSNGTINTDACNFWEEIAVAWQGAFGCTKPGFGASHQSWNNYYDCYQSIVCRTC